MIDIRKRIMDILKYEKEHPVRTFLKNFFWRWPVHVLPRKIRDTYYNINVPFRDTLKGFQMNYSVLTIIYETLARSGMLFLESRTGTLCD